MAQDVWVNIWNGHFKVWGFDMFQNRDNGHCEVIVYWGKIGLPMDRLTKKTKLFTTYGDAYDYIMEGIKTRDAHGYKRIPNAVYFPYTYDTTPLSELVELIEKQA